MKSILIPSIIDLLSKYNRLAALTMIIVGVESTLTMFGMRERVFLCCLDNWECSLCLCVVFWFCFLLIMDIRNPLEEMVLKIFLLDIISIRSLSTSQVSSTDRMFFFSLYDQAPFCFHVTLFFLLWSHAFFFFSSLYHWEHVVFLLVFFLFVLHHSSKCDREWYFDHGVTMLDSMIFFSNP